MMGQNEATAKRCRHITAGVLEGEHSLRQAACHSSRESTFLQTPSPVMRVCALEKERLESHMIGEHPPTFETSAPRTTFMKRLLCAVVLITGTGVIADDTMKTAGDKIDKAAAATKGTVKKAAIEIANASKKAASDVSSTAKKVASGTADTTKKAWKKADVAKKAESDAGPSK